MKRHQTGEVALVMMVVMLAIVLLSRGHIGMMGHSPAHAEEMAEDGGDHAHQHEDTHLTH